MPTAAQAPAPLAPPPPPDPPHPPRHDANHPPRSYKLSHPPLAALPPTARRVTHRPMPTVAQAPAPWPRTTPRVPPRKPIVPYVPTAESLVESMLDLAQVGPND